jgi:short-subunit dehydrogenase
MDSNTKPSRPTALVTGASWGIGWELASLCARDGHDLVLVARTEERLTELEKDLEGRYQASVRVVPMDLTEPGAPRSLYNELSQSGVEIDVLINNAGFGDVGPFSEADTAKLLDMLQLNVVALTHLTRLFLPGMLGRGRGRILNVASTAAFQPGPFMAVYYATKAYVLSFSEALTGECSGTGVTVTALCPGPTATEFQSRARMGGAKLRRLRMMDARPVAEEGYRAMMNGTAIVVNGFQNRLLAQSVRFAPRSLVRKVTRWLNSE